MSRLDVSSEPSMEDILASIRKIIAEEPPGSRPLPDLSGQAAKDNARTTSPAIPKPVVGRAFEPMPVEPVLTTTPVMNAGVFHPTSRDFAGLGAAEPRFTPLVTLEPAQKPATAIAVPEPAELAPLKVDAAIKSVEDQLSDLLGDDAIDTLRIAEPVAAVPVPALGPVASTPASKGLDFASMMLGRQSQAVSVAPTPEPLPEQKIEPGFTVSRVGYIAEDHTAPAPKAADPFDFDLGPSPFETAKASANVLPIAGPPAVAETQVVPASINVDEIVTAVLENKPTLDALTSASASAAAPEKPELAIHSVAEPVSTPVARPVWAKVSEDNALGQPSVSLSQEMQPVGEIPAPVTARSSNSVAEIVAPSDTVRSMEDTVADLLRPMLRSWLQENMPKIVERALLREMNEQSLIARKTAAE